MKSGKKARKLRGSYEEDRENEKRKLEEPAPGVWDDRCHEAQL